MHCFLDSGNLPFFRMGLPWQLGCGLKVKCFWAQSLSTCEGEHLMCARMAQTPFQCIAFLTCEIYHFSVTMMNGVAGGAGVRTGGQDYFGPGACLPWLEL